MRDTADSTPIRGRETGKAQAAALTAEERARVEGCLGLLYQVARNWWKRMRQAGIYLDDDEFVGVCYTAICRAAQTFDPSKGFRFTTLATAAMHFRCVEHADFLRGRRKGWRNVNARRKDKGLESEPPQGMTFGLCRLEYTKAAPGDDGSLAEAKERAGLVLERLDERTRGAAMLRARGATLAVTGEHMGGISRERARQLCEEAGRSGVLRSWAGLTAWTGR